MKFTQKKLKWWNDSIIKAIEKIVEDKKNIEPIKKEKSCLRRLWDSLDNQNL